MEIGNLLQKIVEQNLTFGMHFAVVTAVTTQAATATTATGSVSTATKAVTLSAANSAIVPGMAVTGTNIQASTYVYSTNGTDMIMTKVGASINGAAALTFYSTRLSIQLSGASTSITGIRYLSSYATPAVNDVVVCLVDKQDIIVLGKLT